MTQVHQRNREMDHLHPLVRGKVATVIDTLDDENLPFRVFEGFRSPQRQQYLYDQGRSRPGSVVTHARPWTSYHQYGMAVDFVLFEDGSWSWDDSGAKRRWWQRLHEIGRENGLTPLTWELPHMQLPDLHISELQAGHYPPEGDLDWAGNLESAIYSWTGYPPSPSLPDIIPDRPAMETGVTPPVEHEDIPLPETQGWHNRYGGREWRFDENGVYIRGHENGRKPLRTRGEPVTCRSIWRLFGDSIVTASRAYRIPIGIIMMVIATETAFARRYGFTGPHTFRWEPHVAVKDVSPPVWGDYSAGPMQTLATTARWVVNVQNLDYDPFSIAPVFQRRPDPPETLPLYDAAVNIDIGSAEIRQRVAKTGLDPILVAAAFNAGGLYKSTKNPWHFKSSGDHLDRAARWYGDACAVMAELQTNA